MHPDGMQGTADDGLVARCICMFIRANHRSCITRAHELRQLRLHDSKVETFDQTIYKTTPGFWGFCAATCVRQGRARCMRPVSRGTICMGGVQPAGGGVEVAVAERQHRELVPHERVRRADGLRLHQSQALT